jgi:enoyl-[acyl-carrier-protein] reductase (NADH)
MDNNTLKIELVKLILNINNDNFIKRITDFVNNEKSDFWKELTTSEQAEIKKGIEQLDNGRWTSRKEVLKKIS